MDQYFQLTKGCGGYPAKAPAEPEFVKYDFRGRHYVWDPNSMVLATYEGEIPEMHPVEWKPTFRLANAPACPHLVLELTDACNLACSYCVPPDSLITMSDGTTRQIGSILVGDKVLGFNERSAKGKHTRYEEAIVQRVLRRRSNLVKITLDNGSTLVSTPEHPWFTGRSFVPPRVGTTVWQGLPAPEGPLFTEDYWLGWLQGLAAGGGTFVVKEYGSYKRKNTVRKRRLHTWFRLALKDEELIDQFSRVADRFGWTLHTCTHEGLPALRVGKASVVFGLMESPAEESDEYVKGWLAGFFDAEGCISGGLWSISQNKGEHLIRCVEYLHRLGFKVHVDDYRKCQRVRLLGKSQPARFIAMMHPQCFRKRNYLLNKTVYGTKAKIIAVEDIGEGDVVNLTTSSRTYVSQGALCHNCFVSEDNARSRAKKTMTFETAVDAISKFSLRVAAKPTPSQPVSIGFFGGEPLVAGALLRKIVKYAEGVFGAGSCRFHLTTNATLINEEWAQYINKHNFSLIVSIDGPQHAHDATRKTHSGDGSYSRVIKALELLRTYAPRAIKATTLRATFTPNSNCSLVDRLKHLNHLCDRGFGTHVSVEPAFLGERVCFDKSKAGDLTPDPTVQEQWLQEAHEAADWYIERIREGQNPPRYHHFSIHIKRLLQGYPQPTECGAGKGYFSVGADGTIYACHRETATMIGHLDYGIDHELAAPWQDNRYYARKGCTDCWMRNVCGGGCREVAMVQNGDLSVPVSSECAFKELWFKEAAHIIAELKTTEWVHRMPFLKQVVGLVSRRRVR